MQRLLQLALCWRPRIRPPVDADDDIAPTVADPFAPAHEVLFDEDLLAQQLWPFLDAATKAALRGVCSTMRSQVDGAITRVGSPSSGFSAADLTTALRLWPGVRDLTLLGVQGQDASNLQPLATASLAGLTTLSIRQVGSRSPTRRAREL
jgi:hypothetical protein